MARLGKPDQFKLNLLNAMHPLLPGQWHIDLAHWSLVREEEWGIAVVEPTISYKHLPVTDVILTYGVAHKSIEPILRRLAEAAKHSYHSWYQVRTDTFNAPLVPERKSLMVYNYNTADFAAIARELLDSPAVNSLMARFRRFADLMEIRRSLDEMDRCLFDAVDVVVAIDVTLGDMEHLRRYCQGVQSNHRTVMVNSTLAKLGMTL